MLLTLLQSQGNTPAPVPPAASTVGGPSPMRPHVRRPQLVLEDNENDWALIVALLTL